MCIKGNWENDRAIMSYEGVSKVVNQEALEQIEELLQKMFFTGKQMKSRGVLPRLLL